MSGTRLLPHRTASSGAIDWGPWMVSLNSSELAPLGDRLAGWDYQSSLAFELRPSIDRAQLMESTGIVDPAAFQLIGLVDCKASNRRFATPAPVSLDEEIGSALRIEVPSREVAKQLELSAHLVLGVEQDHARPGIARRVGSRLGESGTARILLEGDGSRFPTEVASFELLALEQALWSVQVQPSGLDSGFVGCTRLLINRDLDASGSLLTDETDSATFRFLQIDVARQLVYAASTLGVPEADLMAEWDEGTFGSAVQELARGLLGSDLVTCVSYVKSDPTRLERILQEAFRPWEEA